MRSAGKHVRKTYPRPKKSAKEYFIWCDESDRKGKYFSHFYGGILVKSDDLKEVHTTLRKTCLRLHLFDELKWHKVSQHYVQKYIQVMDAFFDCVKENKVKVRIMFTQNSNAAKGSKNNDFFILYYQFIKHAFGLAFHDNMDEEIYLRLYFDHLPDSLAKRQIFKEYIKRLPGRSSFGLPGIKIRRQDVAEVDSKKHLLLQMLDIVLGSVCFRLNNKHKELPSGEKRSGKRTSAKEKLYKHINRRIREIYPRFNIASNTAGTKEESNWENAYRHWKFLPSQFDPDESLS